MWLRITVVVLFVAYVGYRLVLAVGIARARRRGDTAREKVLRRWAFWSFHGAVGVLVVGGLLFLGLVFLSSH
jgi:hypothetical protein